MLNDFNCSCPVYIACGYTDLRRGLEVRLPQNERFAGFDLAVDQSEDIKKIEG